MLCSKCGKENPSGANFCSSCGNALGDEATITFAALDLGDEQAEATLTEAMAELASGDAMLFATRGPNHGATYLLDTDEVSVGRQPDNDIFLDDVTVSRHHAKFRRDNQRFSICDVGSLNGTYLNGERVDSKQLQHGDEIQIGKFKLVFISSASEN